MEWREYHQRYLNAVAGLVQTGMIALAASESFADFPNRLPDHIRKPVLSTFAQVAKAIEKKFGIGGQNEEKSAPDPGRSGEEGTPNDFDLGVSDDRWSKFGHLALMRLALKEVSDHKVRSLNWERQFCAQCLVMMIAHLEGFLKDSLRAICRTEPRTLKKYKDRKIDWGTVLETPDRDALLNHLIERFLRQEVEPGSVCSALDTLRGDFGLRLQIGSEEETVKRAEQIRHAAVHNAGRVDKSYLRLTSATDLAEGEEIPISPLYVHNLGGSAGAICSEVFFAASRKFFDVDATQKTPIQWSASSQARE